MVSFSGNLTNPPNVSTDNPVGTAKNWAGYVIVAAMAFVGLGIASNVIAPIFGNALAAVGLTSGEETTSGIPVSGEL